MTDWHALSEPLQLQLAEAAMREATQRIAAFAESVAAEMGAGSLADRGGEEALLLFASMVRGVLGAGVVAGHA